MFFSHFFLLSLCRCIIRFKWNQLIAKIEMVRVTIFLFAVHDFSFYFFFEFNKVFTYSLIFTSNKVRVFGNFTLITFHGCSLPPRTLIRMFSCPLGTENAENCLYRVTERTISRFTCVYLLFALKVFRRQLKWWKIANYYSKSNVRFIVYARLWNSLYFIFF